MINIPTKISGPLTRDDLSSLNGKISGPISRDSVFTLNESKKNSAQPPRPAQQSRPSQQSRPAQQLRPSQPSRPAQQSRQSQPSRPVQQSRPAQPSRPSQSVQPQESFAPQIPDIVVPGLVNTLRKGQKTSLDPQNRGLHKLKACFGWNVKDSRCDMDASAFLTLNTGKVPGDEWFVFYGQTVSPDNSVAFIVDQSGKDREIISIDLDRLNSSIKKIVFVLTINEAFENHLNFSMIKDAYVRILDGNTNREIVSFRMEEYYNNVTSMTIGELYLHNGSWKFNPVGNGVNQDLAGQCAIYGVEIA